MMKNKKFFIFLLFVFTSALILESYAIYLQNEKLELIAKPFLNLTLIGVYIYAIKKINWWYLGVLFFALLGDYFMIFKFKDSFLFAGLIAFFLSHILLLKIFFGYQKNVSKKQLAIYSIPYVIGVGTIFLVISDNLGKFFLIILIHVVTIGLLANISFLNYMNNTQKPNFWIFIGVFCFVGADCLFGLYRFLNPKIIFSIFVTTLYAIGQLLICKSIIAIENKEKFSPY